MSEALSDQTLVEWRDGARAIVAEPRADDAPFMEESAERVATLTQSLLDHREALKEYAEHNSWRCAYRSRYGTCRCGLDDTMVKLGLPIVTVHDPEAKASSD